MARYQAVLFDVDGTLVHSSPGILDTMRYTFERMGTDISGIDLTQYLGPPLRDTFARHYSSPELVEKAVLTYRAHYAEKGQYGCSLYPGAVDMLRRLRESGIRLYTATSKPRQVALPILQYLDIEKYFDHVGGASMDASLDTKTAVVRHVLARPELQGCKTLMVGDRKDDMRGAAECGLDAAAVLYGYGSYTELEPWNPRVFAETCEQLADWILK